MKESTQKTEQPVRTIQASGRNQKVGFVDNRTKTVVQNIIQRQRTDIYLKRAAGTYTDGAGQQQNFNFDENTDNMEIIIATTKSHPQGRVDYESLAEKALIKARIIPRGATNVVFQTCETYA